jgi:PAS domain S-box-containing protein
MEAKEQATGTDGQLFYNAFRASPVGVALEDMEGRPLYVNPALCSMLGFSEEELLKKHCVDFSPPEDAEKDWALFQQLKSGSINHYSVDKRYFRRDGSLVWGRLSISLLRDSASPMVVAMVVDITENKKTQEAMLRAQHDLDIVTRETAVAAARCSRDFRYLWANQGCADVLQRPLDEIIGQPIANVLGAETFEALRHYFERVLAGEVVTYERVANYPGVGSKSILATYTPTFGADGLVDGWVVVIVDISERKRTEEAIRESERRYRRIVETTNEGVWQIDSTLHNSYVNRQLAEMLGYEPSEMIERSVFDFYFPEDVEYKKQALVRRQHGTREQVEERLRRKNGSELWVHMSATPLFKENGEFDGALAMVEDITGRLFAERELSETNERLRLTMEAGGIGGWAWDIRSGKNLWFGQKHAQLGVRPEVHSESVEEFWDRVHPEDRGWLQNIVQKAMENHAELDVEFRVVWSDGSVHWLGSRARFFYGADGEAERMLGTAADITQRKLAEEALSKVSQKLIQAQELERSRLARELHDDINQRLSLLTVALDGLKHQPPESTDQWKQHITAASEHVADIAKDIQTLSHRLHSPKLELLGLTAAASSFCKEFSQRQNVEIDFQSANIPKNLPEDISLTLYRVLQEALQNAVKHSGSRHFRVSLVGETDAIELAVQDSGVGFEPDEAVKGQGLGLASMKERMKLVEGELSINSQLQQGTTIRARVRFDSKSRAAGASASK